MTERSRKGYVQGLEVFNRFLKEKNEGEMREVFETVQDYREWLKEQKKPLGVYYSAEWMAKMLFQLKTFFHWMTETGRLERNPLNNYSRLKTLESLTRFCEERRKEEMLAKIGSRGIEELSEEFSRHVAGYSKSCYVKVAREAMRDVKGYCLQKGVTVFTFTPKEFKGLIFEWVRRENRHSLKMSPESVLRYCGVVKVFFEWVAKSGYSRENPFRKNRWEDFKAWIEEALREGDAEHPLKKRRYSLREILKAYTRYLKQVYQSYDVQNKIYKYLREFIRYLLSQGKSLYTADESLMEDYKKYLKEKEYSPGRFHTAGVQAEKIWGVKRFYDWFTGSGYSSHHPLKKFKVKCYERMTTRKEKEGEDLKAKVKRERLESIPEEFRRIYRQVTAFDSSLNLSESAVSRREKGYRYFLIWLGSAGIKDIALANEDLLVQYQIYLNQGGERKLKLRIQSELLTALKRLCRYLARMGIHNRDISLYVEMPKVGRGLPTAGMNNREALKLMEQTAEGQKHKVRNRAILETLYSTGVRVNELRNVKIEDVDFSYGLLRVNVPKGGISRQRVIPIGEKALSAIREYLEQKRSNPRGTEYLFLSKTGRQMDRHSILRVVKGCAFRGGMKRKIVTHSFRVTCATEMLKNRADIKYVQQQLGHSSIMSTERYLRLMPGDLKKIHKKCHPRG